MTSLLLLSYFAAPLRSVATCEEPLASLIPPAAPTESLEAGPYERLTPYRTRLNLGVGRLYPPEEPDGPPGWNWQIQIRLPLFVEPGGDPFAWLVDGWLLDLTASAGHPSVAQGMIETDYESSAFIVLDERADGWVRIRYAAGEEDRATAWTHSCFFDVTEGVTLRVERWEDRFLSGSISPLYFRAEVRHSLRAGPSTDADRVLWIPADQDAYDIVPVEVRGAWMRVRVTIPSTYCYGPDAPPSTETEGWIKWRDDDVGPWVWYYTRGC